MSRQLVIVENEGRPDVANSAKHLEICTMNEVENKFKRYKIVFDKNGFAQLECLGNYDQDDQSEGWLKMRIVTDIEDGNIRIDLGNRNVIIINSSEEITLIHEGTIIKTLSFDELEKHLNTLSNLLERNEVLK